MSKHIRIPYTPSAGKDVRSGALQELRVACPAFRSAAADASAARESVSFSEYPHQGGTLVRCRAAVYSLSRISIYLGYLRIDAHCMSSIRKSSPRFGNSARLQV